MLVPSPRTPSPRESGIRIGYLEPGPFNAITDVPDVRVGHVTVWRDEPEPPAGRGVARTGVTAILPGDPATLVERPVPAGAAVLNAAGELTGYLQISEWGVVETPVYLTATMQVGARLRRCRLGSRCRGALGRGRQRRHPGRRRMRRLVAQRCAHRPRRCRRRRARGRDGDQRPGGAGCGRRGTGMLTLGWKGGIGTASRICPQVEATLGVLVLSNFGSERDLRIDGVPVGETLTGGYEQPPPAGSCIAVVMTDAPLRPLQLQRRRASMRSRAGPDGLCRPSRLRRDLSSRSHPEAVAR